MSDHPIRIPEKDAAVLMLVAELAPVLGAGEGLRLTLLAKGHAELMATCAFYADLYRNQFARAEG